MAPWALDAFVNKTVDSRFCGRDSLFHLSQGLFSSFDIDDGTRLLLKSIAQRLDLDRLRSCLDVGCGVGAIGVSVKSRAAQATVVMQDRDALAVAFAEENSRANGQPDAEVDCGLAFWHLGGRTFDLVASNLPAKAGAPVLEAFIRLAPSFLTPQGVVAVVIVAPLADFATAAIKSLGHELAYSESTKGYTVLHFRAGGGGSSGNGGSGAREKSAESLEPYIRHKGAFTRSGHTYELTTAWSLPDFDTVGHGLDLAMEVLSEVTLKGEALFWNPGQGHVPACLVSNLSNAFSGISLAARDFLELAMTERNLRDCGRPPRVTKPVPSEAGLMDAFRQAGFDFLYAAPQPVPRAPWHKEMAEAARALLRPDGTVFLHCTSTEVHRFLEELRGFRLLRGKKRFGHRAVLLKKLPL